MGHWNYRVVVREHSDGREAQYQIHEAYYDDDVRVEAITEDPVPVTAESLEELAEELRWMARALEAPVLKYEDAGRQQQGRR